MEHLAVKVPITWELVEIKVRAKINMEDIIVREGVTQLQMNGNIDLNLLDV